MATTASRLLNDGVELHFYVRIEGVGFFEGGQSKSLYLFSRLPDWVAGATQKFIDGLHVPAGESHSIDVIGGVEKAATLDIEFDEWYNNVTTTTYQAEPIWGSLFASSRALYDTSTTYPVTFLDALLTHAAGTATVKSTAAFPASGQLCIGNETLTYSGTTATTFTGLTRGLHPVATGDDSRRRHRVLSTSDIAVDANPIVASVPFTWYNRRIALYVFHRDQDGTWGTEAESLLRYKGRIQSRSWTGEHWKFSTRSIITDLDRQIFTLANPEKQTVGIYVTQFDSAGGVTNRVKFYNSDGTYVTADSYTFDLTTNYFTSPLAMALDFSDQSRAARPGGDGPYLMLAGRSPYDGFARQTNLKVDAPTPSPTMGSALLTPSPGVRYALVLDDGSPVPTGDILLTYGTDTIAGDAVMRLSQTDGSFSMRMGYDETLRITNVLGWVSAGAMISQGDWPTPNRRFAAIEIGDDTWAPIEVRSITDGNPAQVVCRALAHLGVFPASRTELMRDFIWHTARSRVRTLFVPYLADGFGKALLRMMLSTGGAIGGTYDVLADGYGAGIDDNDVDIASFENLDTMFDIGGGRRFGFVRPHTLREILDGEAKLLGFMVVMSGGKITLRKVPTHALVAGTESVLTLNEANQDKEDDRPTFHESADGIYNTFELKVGWDDVADKFVGAPLTIVDTQSQDIFAGGRTLSIESKSLRETANLSEQAGILTNRMMMFRFPYPRVERSLSRDLWGRLVVGDRVRLTDRTLPNPFGASYGVTNLMAFIERLSWNYKERNGKVTLRLFPSDRFAPLAPSAEITAYVDATRTLTLAATTFGGNGASNDATLFDTNDRVLIFERNSATVGGADSWARIVESRTATTIVLTVALSAPAFDAAKEYGITFDLYSTVLAGANSADQIIEAAFMADQADGVIETTQDFYQYS